MPLSPALALSLVVASLHAMFFHLVWGKRPREIPLYWLVGLIGFGVGQGVASILRLRLLMIGDVHVVEGSLVCWLALFVAKRLKV